MYLSNNSSTLPPTQYTVRERKTSTRLGREKQQLTAPKNGSRSDSKCDIIAGTDDTLKTTSGATGKI